MRVVGLTNVFLAQNRRVMDARKLFEPSSENLSVPSSSLAGSASNYGQSFAKFEASSCIVNFQKSGSSTSQLVKFTVNLGVASAHLSPMTMNEWRRRPPAVY